MYYLVHLHISEITVLEIGTLLEIQFLLLLGFFWGFFFFKEAVHLYSIMFANLSSETGYFSCNAVICS